jgi:hypothetical protein
MRHATYQYRLTLGNMYVMQLTSTVWYLATCTSCNLPVPCDISQHVRHATYQNHLERNDTHDELTAEEVEQKQRTEHGVQLVSKSEAKWTCWYQCKICLHCRQVTQVLKHLNSVRRCSNGCNSGHSACPWNRHNGRPANWWHVETGANTDRRQFSINSSPR